MNSIFEIGEKCLARTKQDSAFPFRTGTLKNKATNGFLVNQNTYCINFSSTIAPYVVYLQEGTRPHDIPFAFVGKGNWVWWYPYKDGVPFLMGMGGRFNGKFHPGSTKHKGFIDKIVLNLTKFISSEYEGNYEVK